MNALPKAQIPRFTEKAIHLARRTVFRYSSKFSKHRYTLPQHVVPLCLKVRKNMTYRGLLDELIEMPRIRRVLGLAELPAPSTLCKVFNRLHMAVWRVLSTHSAAPLPTGGIVGVAASVFDCSQAAKHYTKRAELTIQQLKVTLLVDTKVNAILDLHVSTRGSSAHDHWWKQFRELTIACLIHNLDRSLSAVTKESVVNRHNHREWGSGFPLYYCDSSLSLRLTCWD